MLPAPHRMRRSEDFDRAVRGGVRAGRSTMVVHLASSADEADGPSVGFVVSKAVGNAVVRNRVKRRMRAIVSQHLDDLAPTSLVVVRALPAASGAASDQLENDYLGCMRRLARRTEHR